MTKDDRCRFTFRLPEKLMNELKELAQERGISLNSFILEILWDWMKKNCDYT